MIKQSIRSFFATGIANVDEERVARREEGGPPIWRPPAATSSPNARLRPAGPYRTWPTARPTRSATPTQLCGPRRVPGSALAIASAATDMVSASAHAGEGRAGGPLPEAARWFDRAVHDLHGRAPARTVSQARHLRAMARLIAVMGTCPATGTPSPPCTRSTPSQRWWRVWPTYVRHGAGCTRREQPGMRPRRSGSIGRPPRRTERARRVRGPPARRRRNRRPGTGVAESDESAPGCPGDAVHGVARVAATRPPAGTTRTPARV
jgi:hypothetical protein